MTDDELRVIEARANAATPGPWTQDRTFIGGRAHRHPRARRRGAAVARINLGRMDARLECAHGIR